MPLDLVRLRQASAVRTRKYTVKLLTPMFSHGWQEEVKTNSGKPRNHPVAAETRGPSLRGVLRYWWRAVAAENDVSALLIRENALFGGTAGDSGESGCKSPVTVRMTPLEERTKKPLRPHRDETKVLAISQGRDVVIELVQTDLGMALDFYHNLIMLFLCLGSMGQRARRGTGSIQWKEFNWASPADFQASLRTSLKGLGVASDFSFPHVHGPGKVIERKDALLHTRPRLLRVWLGSGYQDAEAARIAISAAASACNPRGGGQQYLGQAEESKLNRSRLASPLWCTVRKVGRSYHPVISELDNMYLGTNQETAYLRARDGFLGRLGVTGI